MACSLEQYILTGRTLADVRSDFRAQFPEYAGLTDEVLNRYINQSFCNVPGGFATCCCGYQAFLFGVAHNINYFNALAGTSVAKLQRNAKSKSADGLSITYENLVSDGTPANIANYFSTSAYGVVLLEMLDSCGLTMSPGGFVV